MPTAKLMQFLMHPIALDAMDSLSKGASPKGVLAGIATDIATAKIREFFGEAPESIPVENKEDPNIIDAEFKVINVTPKGKKP
jgi:hypothetical protein